MLKPTPLTLLALTALVSSAVAQCVPNPNQELESAGLIDPQSVKRVYDYQFTTKSAAGPDFPSELATQWELSGGKVVSRKSYSLDTGEEFGKWTYISQNNLLKKVYFRELGIREGHDQYLYNQSQQPVRINRYSTVGTLTEYSTCEYSKNTVTLTRYLPDTKATAKKPWLPDSKTVFTLQNNLLVQQTTTPLEGSSLQNAFTIQYRYDDQKRLVETITTLSQSEEPPQTVRYAYDQEGLQHLAGFEKVEYTKDARGNWISRTVFMADGIQLLETRKIEYVKP